MKLFPAQKIIDCIVDQIRGLRCVDVCKSDFGDGANKEVRFLDLRLYSEAACMATVRVYAGGHRRIASKSIDLKPGSNRVAILVRGKLGNQGSVECLVASRSKVKIGGVICLYVEEGPDFGSPLIPPRADLHRRGLRCLGANSPSATLECILEGVEARGGFVWWPELPGIPHTCLDEFTLSGFTPKEMQDALVEAEGKMEEQASIDAGRIKAEAKVL